MRKALRFGVLVNRVKWIVLGIPPFVLGWEGMRLTGDQVQLPGSREGCHGFPYIEPAT